VDILVNCARGAGMKRRENVSRIVHSLSSMKHVRKASESFLPKYSSHNHLQSCLHDETFTGRSGLFLSV